MTDDSLDDIAAIRELATKMAQAEASGDAVFLATVLAADVVIMPPGISPIEGQTSCAGWIAQVLDEVQREFERELT